MLHEPGYHRFFAHPFQFIVPRTLIILSLQLQCLNCCIQRQITYKWNLHKLVPVCSWCVSVCRAVLDVSKLGARLPKQHSFRTGWCQQ